jgi:hypothetical protein
MKKMMALMVGFLLLGFAFAAAQEKTQAQAQEKAQVKTELKATGETQQNKVQAKSEFRLRNKIAFVDENGDGINDLAKDADGDGIPNCQDPDWTRPLDGSGYMSQHRNGQSGETGMTRGRMSGQMTKSSFGKGSFRSGATAAARMSGTGVCDGTGPKGSVQRKGRR